ncbi:hypothetical protein TSAR_016606 [Trichomalopsis sarcophagae]|uniref:Elongator complex protein 2 n=1 Tax=Trichomalopsis sarcophagae TaxID=543379 RepID=A0A232EXK8_9HYME|nr:hypothetical protein TSAR_016606 [Trichomalopsis sarcophagae]
MVKTSYISCACNRLPHTADWGSNNLICYAANNAVAIYDPEAKKFGSVLSTLHAHSDRVNVVRWIRPRFLEAETEFLSASSDGTAIIWNAVDLKAGSFKPTDILRINEPTTICDAIYFSSNPSDLLICTGSIDGDFRFWLRVGDQEIEPTQILNFSKKLPIEARLALLQSQHGENPNPLLLLAMEDSTILLYSTTCNKVNDSNQKKIGDFVKVQTLVGHEDWVTCIDYFLTDSNDLFIATGSQDNTIRLWKISSCTNNQSEIDETGELKPKKQNFFIHNREYEIILESILSGHDAWIYEVHWHPAIEVNGKRSQPMKLLSCSLDKSAIIWEPSGSAGIWSEIMRVGEVGGNSSGFYGCKFGPNGKSILTHGYHGSFHMWNYQEKSQGWVPRTAPSGHFAGVVDLCWDPKGRYLLTASIDQTTRVHAPWPQENGEESWHEIGRPQIHGYDMSCLAILKPYMFASGAEEKVVRIFIAPLTFKNYLEKITDDVDEFNADTMAEGASVPALGLTNKAVLDDEPNDIKSQNNQIENSRNINYDEPPLEEELVRGTLWPELQKLYGHGYEIFSMAARHDGTLLATSSKSTSAEHAAIILWNTKSWSQAQKLSAHQLTVTQLAFSPNDKYLLSVSRDRRWALFINCENEKYELLVISSKKDSLHTRIIWCCAWTNDSKYFATGSRDGKVGIWSANINKDETASPVTDLHVNDSSVTALAFAPLETQDKFFYILAIGYESGSIDVRKIHQTDNQESYDWVQLAFLQSSNAHHSTVKRIAFRPQHKTQQKNVIQLASCGSDSVVKIHDILLE